MKVPKQNKKVKLKLLSAYAKAFLTLTAPTLTAATIRNSLAMNQAKSQDHPMIQRGLSSRLFETMLIKPVTLYNRYTANRKTSNMNF